MIALNANATCTAFCVLIERSESTLLFDLLDPKVELGET